MRAFALLALLPLLAPPALAQQPTSEAHCHRGSNMLRDGGTNLVARVEQLCRNGDIIAIPDPVANTIGSLCDFSRSLYAIGQHTFCVLKLPARPARE
ncbi:MAG: hypothetical protein AB7P02_04370 [Alphaproteobacteria bacterium]